MLSFEYKKHQDLWNYLALHAKAIIEDFIVREDNYDAFDILAKWKAKYLSKLGDQVILNGCYACQYAYSLSGKYMCDDCPFGDEFYCDCDDSPYDGALCAIRRKDAKELKHWCLVIANYEVKKGVQIV